ncbi:MAG: sigma-70 family RNA polymerase sigma factor [Gemmatimonadaceae bacterium]|nr:sigma-70 family RNA polymerase sigma factor [Gemmatimonadaceae bacterium]
MPNPSSFPSGSTPPERGAVTALLMRLQQGDRAAEAELLPLVYADLQRAAESLLRRERPGHTLQPNDLVHEGYLKLAGQLSGAADRQHFVAIAARAMRQVLVDHARKRDASKRGGGVVHVRITNADVGLDVDLSEMVALDDALTRLAQKNPRLPRVVELRFFAGLSEDETAQVLGVTSRTVQRDWATARAWLYKELYPMSTP